MTQLRKILVPTDFSPTSAQAFSYAIWLADKVGASIDLIHVVYPGTDVMDFPAMAAESTRVQVDAAEEIIKVFTEEALTRVLSTTDMEDVPVVRSTISVGTPAAVIADEAKTGEFDLIIIGIRGDHNPMEMVFGSVTTAVLRRSLVPVLVVPEELHAMQIKKVAYATSLDDSDPYQIWKAIQLLRPVRPVLKIVHVRRPEDKDAELDLNALTSYFSERELDPMPTFHESDHSDIEEGLEEFAIQEKLDLMIMYSPKQNLFERLGHRSVTRKMALYSEVPMLVMK